MFKIEKGVPMTAPSRDRSGKWKDLLGQMEVGDSVQLDSQTQATSIRNTAKRMGMQVRCQQQDDESFRAWRVE
jgi:hypothetical protein